MATIALSPGLLDRLTATLAGFASAAARPARDTGPRESLEDRRRFLREMLMENPEAFASDLDVQGYMSMCPGGI